MFTDRDLGLRSVSLEDCCESLLCLAVCFVFVFILFSGVGGLMLGGTRGCSRQGSSRHSQSLTAYSYTFSVPHLCRVTVTGVCRVTVTVLYV